MAAFTNNSQIIILDCLTNEYKVTANPFHESVIGLVMLDDCLVVHSAFSWCVLDTEGGELTRSSDIDPMVIVAIVAQNTRHVNIIRCEGEGGSHLKLVTKFYDKEFTLKFHTAFCFNKNLSIFFGCQDHPSFNICMYDLTKKGWELLRNLSGIETSKQFYQLIHLKTNF